MSRRNAVMAILSLIFIVVLLIAMVLAVSSGIGSLGFLVFGGFSFAILVGVVILAFPILIFVMVTIILLTIEASRATKRGGRGLWARPSTTATATAANPKEPGGGQP